MSGDGAGGPGGADVAALSRDQLVALVGNLRARVTADEYNRAMVTCVAHEAGSAGGDAGPEVANSARKRSRENETAGDRAVASAAAAGAPAKKRTKTPSENYGTEQKKKKTTKRRKKKKRREFDHGRFRRRHVALRVAYLGAEYHGFARQQDMQNNPINTVEHHLFKAMIKVCLIRDVDSCGYSRCGRTDMGVSALGQVVGVWFRSKQTLAPQFGNCDSCAEDNRPLLDPLEELNYTAMMNRVLPDTIRILGWSDVPKHFNARFSCSYRLYRYYFPKRMLDIDAMREAGQKLLGLHDFRNFCKMDVVNVRNFERTLLSFAIRPVAVPSNDANCDGETMYYFEFKGTAFLWHQVRMMVGVLFLVGAGRETPETVDWLLDVENNPRQPHYDMASELPLVLYDCGFQETRFNYNLREMEDISSTLEGIWHKFIAPSNWVKLCQRQTAGSYEERVAALNPKRAAARAWHDGMRAKANAGELGDAGNLREAAIAGLQESIMSSK
eukprot:g1562.t1